MDPAGQMCALQLRSTASSLRVVVCAAVADSSDVDIRVTYRAPSALVQFASSGQPHCLGRGRYGPAVLLPVAAPLAAVSDA